MYVTQGKNKQHFNKNILATAFIYIYIYIYIIRIYIIYIIYILYKEGRLSVINIVMI